jgi:hypothetical protein
MTWLCLILALYAIGIGAVLYFVLYLKTWVKRAWSGPHATEIPLWRWLLMKIVKERK